MRFHDRLKKLEARVRRQDRLEDWLDVDRIPNNAQEELHELLDKMDKLPRLPNGDHDLRGFGVELARIQAIIGPYLRGCSLRIERLYLPEYNPTT